MKKTIALLCLLGSLGSASAIPVLDIIYLQQDWVFYLQINVTPDTIPLHWKAYINDVEAADVVDDGTPPPSVFGFTIPLDFQPDYLVGLGDHLVRFEIEETPGVWTPGGNTETYTVIQPVGPRDVPEAGSTITLTGLAIASLGFIRRR